MKKTYPALAVLMLTCSPAQVVLIGTFQREAWTLEIASASPDGTTAATVYYLGNRLQVVEIMSVPAGDTSSTTVSSEPGKNVRRIIIEVDPPTNGALFRPGQLPESSRARISSSSGISDLHDARLVLNVE